jgi:hypothetical protein
MSSADRLDSATALYGARASANTWKLHHHAHRQFNLS